jgi:hypothetical protein
MRIFVTQFYLEPGAAFPFSYHFQRYWSSEISNNVALTPAFSEAYGPDYTVIFRVSADSGLTNPEVKGPTIYAKDEDVEFSIFIPYETDGGLTWKKCKTALTQLLKEIIHVLETLQLDPSWISRNSTGLVEHVLSNDQMIDRDEAKEMGLEWQIHGHSNPGESSGRVLLDVGFFLAKSKNRSYREMVRRQLTTLVRFLDCNELTKHKAAPEAQDDMVADNLALHEGDLTTDGVELLRAKEYYAWLEGHDRGVPIEDVTKLERALQRIQASRTAES